MNNGSPNAPAQDLPPGVVMLFELSGGGAQAAQSPDGTLGKLITRKLQAVILVDRIIGFLDGSDSKGNPCALVILEVAGVAASVKGTAAHHGARLAAVLSTRPSSTGAPL